MQMSDGERLILVMLAEIMESMKIGREVDPALIKSLAIDNAGWALKLKYSGIFASEPPSDDIVTETTNILWMWGIVEHSIRQLKGTEAQEAKDWHWNKFAGFDGNHDPHVSIARTMITELDQFQEFKGRSLDSHSQSSLPKYQQMYEKFDGYIKSEKASPLPFEALRDLCG